MNSKIPLIIIAGVLIYFLFSWALWAFELSTNALAAIIIGGVAITFLIVAMAILKTFRKDKTETP